MTMRPLLLSTPKPLPRPTGWAVLGAFVAMTAVAIGYELARDTHRAPALLIIAGAAAVALGATAVLGAGRTSVPAAAPAVAAVATICEGNPSNVGWFAALIMLGWCALTCPMITATVLWAAMIVFFVLETVVADSDPGWFAWIAGSTFSLLGCALGRRQHELVLQLRAAQSDLASRAQAEERARIARELHDVIAHSLTVSLLHVSAARLALAEDPAEAERALGEAERLGRASLDEVRHAVGTLRTPGIDATRPLPGSTDVPALIAGFTSAGADVRASVDADLTTLPATVGLATYRILQEALTNAAKHAPATTTTVHLRVAGDAVLLDVDSAGAPGSGSGLGVIGMRERADSVGGRCEAGPGGSGWRVHAELPVLPAPAR